MKLTVRYAGLTDVGRVRQANEDNWTADPEQGLFIVADGMGGEFAGALASKAVVETLPGLVRQHFEAMEGLPKRSGQTANGESHCHAQHATAPADAERAGFGGYGFNGRLRSRAGKSGSHCTHGRQPGLSACGRADSSN